MFRNLLRRRQCGNALLMVAGLVGALLLVAVIVIMWAVGVSNKIVKLNQNAEEAWALVQTQYQRRLDLIPNLVETVKGAAAQELALVVGAVKERAKATQVQINSADAGQMKQFAQNQSELSSALSRLLVTVEKYPEIRTNQNFLELQSQIEGTENRISVERNKFNAAVKEFNNSVLTFPGSVIAGFRGFKERPYFAGDVDAQKAPRVDFGTAGTTSAPSAAPIPAATTGTAGSLPPPPSTTLTPIPNQPPEADARPLGRRDRIAA